MKALPEALKFAWRETDRPQANIIGRGVMFAGAVGRIAHMRATLLFEPEGYNGLPSKQEEDHITRTIDGVGRFLGIHHGV